jgi:hypothetical protein
VVSKSVGNTLVWSAAKMVPPNAAIIAPIANAVSFTRSTATVIDAAASGSSRTARHARPVREVSSSRSTTIVSTRTISTR